MDDDDTLIRDVAEFRKRLQTLKRKCCTEADAHSALSFSLDRVVIASQVLCFTLALLVIHRSIVLLCYDAVDLGGMFEVCCGYAAIYFIFRVNATFKFSVQSEHHDAQRERYTNLCTDVEVLDACLHSTEESVPLVTYGRAWTLNHDFDVIKTTPTFSILEHFRKPISDIKTEANSCLK